MYTNLLKTELKPAFGCTEPGAIAYAASLVRRHLGQYPHSVEITVSGNIVKNVQGVIVPNTAGRKGIKVSVVAGLLAREYENELEVLSTLTEEDILLIDSVLADTDIEIKVKDVVGLYVDILGRIGEDEVRVVIENEHTNLVLVTKNGAVLHESVRSADEGKAGSGEGYKLDFSSIMDYVESVDVDEIRDLIQKQIDYNCGIAEIGLKDRFGLNVGKTIIGKSNSIISKAIAYAAAGSDARMGGSDAPVIINSGSGNQGMTVSIPVYIYGKDSGYETDAIFRAVALSNLVSIYIKSKIGSLSAFCGALSAAAGAGAGIAFLRSGDRRIIAESINNTLSNLTGVICDGAKASCALKISSCLESSFFAAELAMAGNAISDRTGVIFGDVDATIEAIGRVGANGMKETDRVILGIMTN